MNSDVDKIRLHGMTVVVIWSLSEADRAVYEQPRHEVFLPHEFLEEMMPGSWAWKH